MTHGAPRWLLLALPLLALGTLVPTALGQRWVMNVSAGGAEYRPIAAQINARSAIVSLSYEDVPWLYVAGAAPLGSGGLPWGAGGLGTRLKRDRAGMEFGADLAAHAFGYRDRSADAWGAGGTVEALPFVAVSRGSARLELQTGLLHFRSVRDGAVAFRQTMHQSAAELLFQPTARIQLAAEARLARVPEGDYPFAGAEVELGFDQGVVWGQFGRWISAHMSTPVWSIGGSARLSDRARVRAWYEQESEDPLYWSVPRRSWNIGVSHTLGPQSGVASPLPVIAPEVVRGQVTIRLPLSEAAEPPAVAGDFNQWQPVRMVRSPDAWTISLPVPPGVYHYAFQRADGSWFVPGSVPNRVEDGFGGFSAVLVVPPPSGS